MITCPIRVQFEGVLHSAHELTKAVRKLRRAMRRCQECEAAGDCPVRREFGAAIERAVVEVMDEWELVVDG